MKSKVKEWLDKSGYPLEMFVSRILKKRSYICEKSEYYEDVETGALREIDVVALKYNSSEKYHFELTLVIECKKSTHPTVILCDEFNKTPRPEHFLGITTDERRSERLLVLPYIYFKSIPENELLEEIGIFGESVLKGYSLVHAFNKSDTELYKGIMGIVKADYFFKQKHEKFVSEYLSKNENEESCKPDEDADSVRDDFYQMVMPIMVVDSPLCYAFLDESGDTIVEETDWGSLTIRSPIEWDKERLINIQIIRKEIFERAIESIEAFFEASTSDEILDAEIELVHKDEITKIKID